MTEARADGGAGIAPEVDRPADDTATASSPPVTFAGRTFCITGRFDTLRRTQVEREIRRRGGSTIEHVRGTLDYLVVGGASSTGWKFGGYGAKLARARQLREKGASLEILTEAQFGAALAATPPLEDLGDRAKVVQVTYTVTAGHEDDVDLQGMADVVREWQRRPGATATMIVHESNTAPAADLFTAVHGAGRYGIVECRMVQQVPPWYPGQRVADEVAIAFEQLRGVDGRLQWRERPEGTDDYERLLAEIPAWSRLRAS